MSKNPLIEAAIAVAGGQKELARRIGGTVKQQHVHKWLYAKRVPAERALQIEAATQGAVTRQELRPDLWPPSSQQAQEAA